MADNNLGTLSFGVDLKIDEKTKKKLQKQLDTIDVITNIGVTIDPSKIESEINKVLNKKYKIKLDVESDVEDIVKTKTKQKKGNQNSNTFEKEKADYREILSLVSQTTQAEGSRAEQLVKHKDALDKIKEAQKNIVAIEKSGVISTEESIRVRGKLATQAEAHKTASSSIITTLKLEAKEANSAAGSMDQLSAQLSLMKIRYRELDEQIRSGKGTEKTLSEIQQLDTKMKILDASIGNYGRNVGDYASSFYGLSYSIQQVARELPSLAISPQMFIMAISNNLPILQDQLKLSSKRYKELIEQHKQGINLNKKAVPVWKQVIDSIMSWQTALVLLITVFTVFGKQIFEATGKMLSFSKAAKSAKEIQDEINKSMRDGFSNMSSNVSKLDALIRGWKELGSSLKERKKFIEENRGVLDELGVSVANVRDAENLFIDNTSAYIEAQRSRAMADAARSLGAEKYAKYEVERMESEDKLNKLRDKYSKIYEQSNKSSLINPLGGTGVFDTGLELFLAQSPAYNKAVNGIRSNLNSLKKDADSFFNRAYIYDANATDILKEAGIKARGGNDNKSIGGDKFFDSDKATREQERNAKDIEFAIAQARIDALEEGNEKVLQQMKLNHERETEMIKRQREDLIQKTKDSARREFESKAENKGKKFNDSNVTLSPEEEGLFVSLNRETLRKQEAEIANFYQKVLTEYQNYLSAIDAINKKFGEERDILTSQGAGEDAFDELERRREIMIAETSEEYAKRSEEYMDWLDSIANMSAETLEKEFENARLLLSYAEMDAAGGKANGQALAQLRAKIAELQKQLKKKNQGDDKAFDVKRWKAIKDALNDVSNEFEKLGDDIGGTTGDIISASGKIAALTVSMINSIVTLTTNSAEAVKSTSETASTSIKAVEKASVILAIISAALQIAMKIASLFNNDKKHEKEIQSLQDQIDASSRAYENFGRTAERTLGKVSKEARQAQVEQLRLQQALIQQQIEAEKAKKKTDNERVKQMQDQYHQIGVQIQGIFDDITDSILGSIKTLAEELADALVSAFEEGKDASASMTDAIKSHLKDILKQMMIDAVLGDQLNAFQAKMEEMLGISKKESATGGSLTPIPGAGRSSVGRLAASIDATNKSTRQAVTAIENRFTQDQIAELINMGEGIIDNTLDIFNNGGWKELFDAINGMGDLELSALSQGIQGITEEQARIIEAYLNTIRDVVVRGQITSELIESHMSNLQDIQSQALAQLVSINNNMLGLLNAFKSVMASSTSEGGVGLRVYVK